MAMLRKIVLLSICITACYTYNYAQQDNTLFLMHEIPQSNLLNPAVQIPCKVFVGMPLLSSIHVNYSNTFFSYNDIFKPNGDSINLNLAHFQTKPDTKQSIFTEFHISLINFGFIYKNYYFNFNIQDKIDAGVSYPTNLFGLILNGNTPEVGETFNLNGLALFGTYYREWAFGVSKIIDNQLTLGVKAKILFGKANLSTSESELSLFTADPMYYLTARSAFEAKVSPLVMRLNPDGTLASAALPSDANVVSLLLNRKNPGFAADFGAIYKYDSKITLSASLLDLGYIRWRYAPVKLSEASEFTYKGLTYNAQNNSFNNIQEVIDSLNNSYTYKVEAVSFGTFLSPKMYLGGTYSLKNWLNTGVTLRNELYRGKLLSSATLSANAWYKKYLAGSVNWSYINNSFANIGAGISMRTPNFGLYAVSDNVYGAFKYKSARLLNIRFGLNFLFGCKSCSENKNALKQKGCAAYSDEETKKKRHEIWVKKYR